MSRKVTAVILCVGLFGLGTAFAQNDSNWTGATDPNWANAANWDTGVPLATTNAIFGGAGLMVNLEGALNVPASMVTLNNSADQYNLANGGLDLSAGGGVQQTGTAGTNTISASISGVGAIAISVGSGTLRLVGDNSGVVAGSGVLIDGGATLEAKGETSMGSAAITFGAGGGSLNLSTGLFDVALTNGADIGTEGDPRFPGYHSETDGVYTIAGGGSDIWNNGDHGYYAYQVMPADAKEMVARVVRIYNNEPDDPNSDNGQNGWIKAGLRVCDYIDYDSAHESAVNTWNAGGSFQGRNVGHATGGSHNSNSGGAFTVKWVRLKRDGNSFTGYWAYDDGGIPGTWNQQGAAQVAQWEDDEIFAGLSITSHDNGRVEAAIIDNVSFVDARGIGTAFGNNVDVQDDAAITAAAALGVYQMGTLNIAANKTLTTNGLLAFGSTTMGHNSAINGTGDISLEDLLITDANTVMINMNSTASIGTTVLGKNAVLTGGDISSAVTLFSGPATLTPVADKTIALGQVANFDPNVISVNGAGTVALNDVSGSTVLTGTAFQVNSGTLSVAFGGGGNSALADADPVHLKGGTLELTSPEPFPFAGDLIMATTWDDGTGKDSSGRGADATPSAAAVSAPGIHGQAMTFVGNDHWTVPNDKVDLDPASYPNGVSYMAWTNRASTGDSYILGQRRGTSNPGGSSLHFGFRDNNTITNAWWGADINNDPPGGTDQGVWHMVGGTVDWNNTRLELYWDGVNTNGGNDPDLLTTSVDNVLQIGSRSNFEGDFEGLIDTVLIYDRVLSPAEMMEVYNWTPPEYPDHSATDVIVDAGSDSAIVTGPLGASLREVTVEDQAILTVTGDLGMQDLTIPAGALGTVRVNSSVNPVNLNIANGAILAGGGIVADTTNFQGTTGGFSVDAGQTIALGTMNSQTLAAVAVSQIGEGTLLLNDVSDTGNLPSGSTFTVSDGTLAVEYGPDATGVNHSALGGNKVILSGLAGATLDLIGQAEIPLPSAGDLLGAWMFDDAGALGADSSGNGANGTANSDPAYEAAGKHGGAVRLDGDDYFRIPNSAIDLDQQSYTVSTWFQRDGTGNDYFFGQRRDNSNPANGHYHFGIRSNGQATHTFWGSDLNVGNPALTELNTWHMLTGTVQYTTQPTDGGPEGAGNLVLYLDGQPIGTQSRTIGWFNNDFVVGARGDGGDPHNGLMDTAVVYGRALTGAEVAELYNWQPFGPADYSDTDVEVDPAGSGFINVAETTGAKIGNVSVGDNGILGVTGNGLLEASALITGKNAVVSVDTPLQSAAGLSAGNGTYIGANVDLNLSQVIFASGEAGQTVTVATAANVEAELGSIFDFGFPSNILATGPGKTVMVSTDNTSQMAATNLIVDADSTLRASTSFTGTGLADSNEVILNNNSTLELQAPGAITPGLRAGWLSGNPASGDNPENLGIRLGPDGALGPSPAVWTEGSGAGNKTLVYTGYMYLEAGTTTFGENIDDGTKVVIDGTTLIDDGGWNTVVTAPYTAAADGWHEFEVRFRNGGGGYGPVNSGGWNTSFGFGTTRVTGSTAQADYTYPQDPGDGSLFRTDPVYSSDFDADVRVTAPAKIRIDGDGVANLGVLTLEDDVELDGDAFNFAGTAFAASAVTINTSRAGSTVSVGAPSKQAGPLTITKAGDADTTLAFNDTSQPAPLPETTILVNAGTVTGIAAGGNTSLGGVDKIVLDGTTLELSAEKLPPDISGVPKTGNVVAHYGFENNVEDTTGTYDGTAIGGPGFGAGINGSAIILDGSDDYVDLPDGFANFDNGITVSAWVKMSALQNWSRVMDFGNGAGVDNILVANRGTSDDMRWEFHDAGPARNVSAVHDENDVFIVDQWQHLLCTVTNDANGIQSRIFLDGTQIGFRDNWQTPGNVIRTNNYIGESNWGGDAFLAGMMDDVFIYDVGLYAPEVTALMNWVQPEGPETDYGLDVDALAGKTSTLGITGRVKAGKLTLIDTATLNVIGEGSMRFTDTFATADTDETTLTVNVADGMTLFPGNYRDGATDTEVQKDGGGSMIFDHIAPFPQPLDACSTFTILDGELGVVLDGTTPRSPLPNAKFTIDGGALVIASADGAGVSLDNTDADGRQFKMEGSGSVEARQIGNAASTGTVTLPNPIRVPTGMELAIGAYGGYDLIADGDIFDPGSIRKIGDGTVTLNGNAGWLGSTTVSDGELIVNSNMSSTSLIDVIAGRMEVNGFVNISAHTPGSVDVAAGTELEVFGDLEAVTVTSAGTTNVHGTLTTTGNTLTVNDGVTTVDTDLVSTTVTVNAPGQLIVGGDITVSEALNSSGDITVNDIYGGDLAFSGGTTDVRNIDSNSTFVNGGHVDLGGTVEARGGDFGVSNGGKLVVETANGLSLAPNFSVTTQGTLLLEVMQNTLPVMTIGAGALLSGDMSGVVYEGAKTYDPGTHPLVNVVIEDDAVLGAKEGTPVPTTLELGGDDPNTLVRVVGAVLGGEQNFRVGDDANPATTDDIFKGVSLGPWTTSVFSGIIESAILSNPIEVQMNSTDATLQAIGTAGAPLATFRTSDTTVGAEFTGRGNLTVADPLIFGEDGEAVGQATVFTRTGIPMGDPETTVNEDTITLATAGAISNPVYPAAQTLNVSHGRLRITDPTAVADGNNVLLGDGSMMILNNNPGNGGSATPTSGNYHVGAGAMVWVNNVDRLNGGATWSWDPEAIIVTRTDGFDPHVDGGYPHDAHFVSPQADFDAWTGGGLVLADKAYVLSPAGPQNGRIRFGEGIKALQTEPDTATVGAAGTPGRTYYMEDPFDLSVDPDTVPDTGDEYALNLVVGNTDPMDTVWDHNEDPANITRVRTMMTGTARFRVFNVVNEVTVLSGVCAVDLANYDGDNRKVWRSGDIIIPDATTDQRPVFDLRRDGTTEGEVTIDGVIDVGNNGLLTTHQDARIVTNQVRTDTLADEVRVRDGGAVYWWLASTADAGYANEPIPGTGQNGIIINQETIIEGRPSTKTRFYSGIDNAGRLDDNRAGLSMSVFRNGGGWAYLTNVQLDQADPDVPVIFSARPDGLTLAMDINAHQDVTLSNENQSTSGNFQMVDVNNLSGGDITVILGERAEPFDDLNTNGVWDPGEPFADFNADGVRADTDEDWLNQSVYGHIGDGVTLDQWNAQTRLHARDALAETAVIRNVGSHILTEIAAANGWANPVGPAYDGFIEIRAGDDGNPANRLDGNGTIVLGGGQDLDMYIWRGTGTNTLNRLDTKVVVLAGQSAVIVTDNEGGGDGRSIGWFGNVCPEQDATVHLRRDEGPADIIADINVEGVDAFLEVDSADCAIGNVTGNGTLTFRGGGGGHTNPRGTIGPGATLIIDRDNHAIRIIGDQLDNAAGRWTGVGADIPTEFRVAAGGRLLVIDGGAYPVEVWRQGGTTGLGDGVIEVHGEDVGGWIPGMFEIRAGETGVLAEMYAPNTHLELTGGQLRGRVQESAAGLINIVDNEITVIQEAQAPIDGRLEALRGDAGNNGGTGNFGTVRFNDVVMGTGSPVLELVETDGVALVVGNVTADNDGTIQNTDNGDVISIENTTGTGRLTLAGTQEIKLTGTIASNMEVTGVPRLMAGADGNTNWLLTDGSLTVETVAGLGTATFDFNGGELAILDDGDQVVGALNTTVDSVVAGLRIDKLTAGAPDDATFTFNTLVLNNTTANPTLNLAGGSSYNYVFGGTTVNADGPTINVDTEDTDVDLGGLTFGTFAFVGINAAERSTVMTGDLDHGGIGGFIVFGDAPPTGGNLRVGDTTNFLGGAIYVNSGWLLADTLINPGVAIDATGGTGGIDAQINGLGQQNWVTNVLKLSAAQTGAVAPTTALHGSLILNTDTPIDPLYKKADSSPMEINSLPDPADPARIYSDKAGADMQAPLELTGPVVELGIPMPDNGIKGEYYNINRAQTGPPATILSDPGNFDAYAPAATAIADDINLATTTANPFDPHGVNIGVDDIAARWTGYVYAPADGDYTFYTTSDDGSAMWVDDTKVVDNDFWQGMTTRSGIINLTEGYHKIAVGWYEGGGGAGVIAEWTPPGAARAVIPAGSLFQERGFGNKDYTISGDLTGTANLRKVGIETVTLSGNNNLPATNMSIETGNVRVAGNNAMWGGDTTIAQTTSLITDADVTIPGDVENDGTFHVQSGTTDMGAKVISSTANDPGHYEVGLMTGWLPGNMSFEPNPGNLAPQLGPTGGRYGNNWNPGAPTNPWVTGSVQDNKTVVHTGEAYFPAAGDYSFVEYVDDITHLTINGQVILNDAAWNTPTAGTFTAAGEGWVDFEVRFSNGGGGYGPVNNATWNATSPNGFGFGVGVTLGSVNQGDYMYPEDPGDGSLFRWFSQLPATGDIQIDAGAKLIVGGFTDAAAVRVDGELDMSGSASDSDARELVIGKTGKASLGTGTTTIEGPVRIEGDLAGGGELAVAGGNLVADSIGNGGTVHATANTDMSAHVIQGGFTGLMGKYYDFDPINDGAGPPSDRDGWSMMEDVNAIRAWQAANVADQESLTPYPIDFPEPGNTVAAGDPAGNPFNYNGDVFADVGWDDIVSFWEGLLNVPTDATYTFDISSDDGSVIHIDDQLIANNNCLQGYNANPPADRIGSVFLTAGVHKILIGYFEQGGGAGLTARWRNDAGLARQVIPVTALLTQGGDIEVDAGVKLLLGGFNSSGTLDVDGELELVMARDNTAADLDLGIDGVVDLATREASLILSDEDEATILAELIEGNNGGTWDGAGIICSDPQFLAQLPDAGIYAYAGAGGIKLKATTTADVNLDDTVDFDDYQAMNAIFGTATISCDTNYDGVVNHLDYLNLKLHWGGTFTGSASELPPTAAVPEPGTLCLLAFGAAGLVLRRRRRK